jgi:hypothetical protein
MPQKNATFCISWKEKILDEPFKKKPTKHWSQQNSFVGVPKSSQMNHWSKAKVASWKILILLILS